ncbi:ImmA/IrrE family metallo-endopeptidase [Bacillus pumilus]|uniref:ImmA/IrrE family metallo-endopeptidase n=1 Tax=Bacillus pumilus TaxID=1408 RepID=UPI0021B20F9E|nr:ImmA/IrrE family metallo-endopeptidase [Bacillus pumilus]
MITITYYFTQLEDDIQTLYKQMNIRNPYEITLENIAQKLDIELYFRAITSRAIIIDKKPIIILDNREPHYKQREKFSHEIGHILKHSGNQLLMPEPFRLYQEWKAKNFMYHFAVPTFMLNNLKQHDLNEHFISENFNVSKEFARTRIDQYKNKAYFSKNRTTEVINL